MPTDPLAATYGDYLAALLRRGDLSDPATAVFTGTNEKDAAGDAVVRAEPGVGPSVNEALSPWTKAQTIGAARATAPGRYDLETGRPTTGYREPAIRAPTWGEWIAGQGQNVAEALAASLPAAVLDQLGLTDLGGHATAMQQAPGWQYGDVPLPTGAAAALGDLRPAALQKLGPAKWRRGTEGRYAGTALTGRDADHVMAALENVTERFPHLKQFRPEMERALAAQPQTAGSFAEGVFREPESGLILPTPGMMGRWARYGLYGEEIPANWGPLTQPGIREAFGADPREIKLYADLWGAISPLNDPMANTMQANRAYARTLGPSGLSPMSEAEFTSLGLGLPSRRPNINRAMAGEPLSGPKVPRMSGMLEGTESLPPIDEHVTTASGGATGKWASELPALRAKLSALTGDDFKGPQGELRLNKLVSEGLVEMWRAMYPDRPPLTSMAASWEGIRSDKGIKSVGGPYDILRRLGLGEKGAMSDPARVAGAKWPGGYISSGVLLPILLQRWAEVTDAQPENAPASDGPGR